MPLLKGRASLENSRISAKHTWKTLRDIRNLKENSFCILYFRYTLIKKNHAHISILISKPNKPTPYEKKIAHRKHSIINKKQRSKSWNNNDLEIQIN